jgi:hypothetical protein
MVSRSICVFASLVPILAGRHDSHQRPREAAMYIVTYCKAHAASRLIATAGNFAQAFSAARKAGAVDEGQKVGRDFVFDVVGHEGDDDYGVWIETPRRRHD